MREGLGFIRHCGYVMTVAYLATSAEPDAGRPAKVMVIGQGEAALLRGVGTISSSGRFQAMRVGFPQALQILDERREAAAVWVEADEGTAELARLLERIDADVRDGRYRAVVAIHGGLIDFVTSLVSAPGIEVVVGSSELERASVLAIATLPRESHKAREAANESNAVRLQQLSEEVGRIAAALAQLSGPAAKPIGTVVGTPQPAMEDKPHVPADSVRSVIKARRLRGRLLPEDLFADPAWDMLLDLLQAELVQHRVPVSSLCIAAAVPPTTALRWIKTMTDRGLLLRRADPHDGRRVFIEMAAATSVAMRRFFRESGLALA